MAAERRHEGEPIGLVKLAIMAVGGQGGGVLTNWIEDCARTNGYAVQATSVAGVAQRTGATIYYIEMAPQSDRQPVFSLMPAAGDVDILLAAEMMEAGRAILRGFVTPDRTTLIASSHRALAVSEKTVPGDGMANSAEVLAAGEIAARRFIYFDMNRIALDNGTVISASLLGALAGSATLPFSRDRFEEAITRSGRGVDASLKAFASAFDHATGKGVANPATSDGFSSDQTISGPKHLQDGWSGLLAHIEAMPPQVKEIAEHGLKAVVDFQDISYGHEYLARLDKVLAVDDRGKNHELSRTAAKYIARAMAYDDIFRVADLKTRSSRFVRIQREMNQPAQTRMMITEFMHPRAEELVSMLPVRMGRKIVASTRMMRWIDTLFNRGRRLRTDRLLPFLQLYVIGGLKRWRRGTMRHADETAHINSWLDGALASADVNYDFAVEMISNRRLIKGYSDTHARGISKYDRVNEAAMKLLGRPDAAQWVRRLREAALLDEEGKALDGAMKTVDSFVIESKSA